MSWKDCFDYYIETRLKVGNSGNRETIEEIVKIQVRDDGGSDLDNIQGID